MKKTIAALLAVFAALALFTACSSDKKLYDPARAGSKLVCASLTRDGKKTTASSVTVYDADGFTVMTYADGRLASAPAQTDDYLPLNMTIAEFIDAVNGISEKLASDFGGPFTVTISDKALGDYASDLSSVRYLYSLATGVFAEIGSFKGLMNESVGIVTFADAADPSHRVSTLIFR